MIPEILVGSILMHPSEIMTLRYSMEVLLKKHFSGLRYRTFFARQEKTLWVSVWRLERLLWNRRMSSK